jgi:hypothetical protein
MLPPHGVLEETRNILEGLSVQVSLTSDHYTNYVNLCGNLPQDKPRLLEEIETALKRDASQFRPFFIGTQ